MAEPATEKTYPPVAAGTVMIDFDGTIVPWGPLMGDKHIADEVVEAIQALSREGYRIGIFTSRLSKAWARDEVARRDGVAAPGAVALFLVEQRNYVSRLLALHDVPFDFITAEKVPALAYFDDRAFRVSDANPLHVAIATFMEMPC